MDPPTSDHCGYDDKLFVTVPPEYLRCGICCLVLRNPVQILQCGHKYCAVCFQRIKQHAERNNRNLRCPIDREIIDSDRVCEDLGLQRAVGSLPVQCSRADIGCSWMGELSDIDLHQQKCSFALQPQMSVDNAHVIGLVTGLSERVEVCESSLIEKEKEILHLKYNLNEMKRQHNNEIERMSREITQIKTHYDDDVNRINAEVSVLTEKNGSCEKELLSNTERSSAARMKADDAFKQVNILQKRFDEMETKISEVKYETLKVIDFPNMASVDEKVGPSENESAESKGAAGESEDQKKNQKGGSRTRESSCVGPNSGGYDCKKNPLMQIDKGSKAENTIISAENIIEFKSHVFSTVILPNGVVKRGEKVWYEVQVYELETSSRFLQVGWAMTGFISSEKNWKGVGNCQFSYSIKVGDKIEGCLHKNFKKCWGKDVNCGAHNVIGVALDLVKGQMLFSHNGHWAEPLGTAFDDINTDQHFFPAISFGDGKVKVNMGEKDFMFGPPDKSFKSVMDIL